MAKATRRKSGNSTSSPDLKDYEQLRSWLQKQPREWVAVIAMRAAIRVFPLVGDFNLALPAFRALAAARFATKFPEQAFASVETLNAINDAYTAAYTAASGADAGYAAFAAADAAFAAGVEFDIATPAADALNNAARAARSARVFTSVFASVKDDILRLDRGSITSAQLASAPLWHDFPPRSLRDSWIRLSQKLRTHGEHWSIWTDWYDGVSSGVSPSEVEDAAFTDFPGRLPWEFGAKAVNVQIAERLTLSRDADLSEIPDQSLAPVRVEEREGRVSKIADRDSALGASEQDFKAWRDPVIDHIAELLVSEFASGTNHGRIRERLVALEKLLPGDLTEVKDRQFRIGYEIERFEGLMTAYRIGGEDMPILNAAQLEDLDRMRVVLKMGIDKLERWSEFRRQANESTAGEAEVDREIVGETLDEVALIMEQRPQYFDPKLPATFRFLSEAVRDPVGATKTVIYGAVKSTENVVSFLAQRALGIGKKSIEAVEKHISTAVATGLVTTLGSAALGLSAALPQGWAWLKPLLAALGVAR